MKLKINILGIFTAIIIAMSIGVGCMPSPTEPGEQEGETSVTSPLALPGKDEPASGSAGDVSPLARPTPTREEVDIVIPAEAEKAVLWAQADLAERLHVTTDQIAVVSIEFVQWRDSSLGCPQPDMMYAQVITPGYRIVLRGGGEQHEYHSAQGRGKAVPCK